MRPQRSNTPPAQRCVTGWEVLKPQGAPEPSESATRRAEAYCVGLVTMGVKPETIRPFKLLSGGWAVRWRDGFDRYAKFFFNDTTRPELLLINEEKVEV
jgi:hypothetical protein